MGDREKASLRLQFNPQIRLELHGATITSDAGLLAFRELDDALDLTPIAWESRTGPPPPGRPVHLQPLATMIPTMQIFPKTHHESCRGLASSDRNAARTNTIFETETLLRGPKGLALMNPQFWPWQASDSGQDSSLMVSRKEPPTGGLLSSPLSVQPVWGLRRSDATPETMCRWQELLDRRKDCGCCSGVTLLLPTGAIRVSGTRKDYAIRLIR